jgi:OPA family glycerol-3-phosphate transporter-like MFS transporter
MLIGVLGSVAMNIAMGLTLYGNAMHAFGLPLLPTFTLLYALNMYFQSFGAVAIVTVKAPWFHVRERGTFSTIFGTMIALGLYFAFDWGAIVVEASRGTAPADIGGAALALRGLLGAGGAGVDQDWWIFFVPAAILSALWIILLLFLRDRPADAGFDDFETGESTVSEDGERLPIRRVFLAVLTHPVLAIVCGIEFCSGILRNGVMHWYTFFAKETGITHSFFVTENWGLCLLIAGVFGSLLTGWASDRFFQSRRAPMAGLLYALMLASTIAMCFGLEANPWVLGAAALLISMSVIGVHGILSGTSTADFGGTKNAGAATGIVDGLVYLGTAMQSLAAGFMTPKGEAARDPGNWIGWPVLLVPFAVIGLALSIRIWGALPEARRRPAASPSRSAVAGGITVEDELTERVGA